MEQYLASGAVLGDQYTLEMEKIACGLFASLLLAAGPAFAQAAIALERMNAICPGVDNPIIVAVNDVPDSNLLLIPSMGSITRQGRGYYNWRICHRDTTFATLTIRDTAAQQEIGTFTYRVVRPPVPVPVLASGVRRGSIPNGQFKAQGGLAMVCENTDFDIRAEAIGYGVTYFAANSDPLVKYNTGARFDPEVLDLINRAKPGDRYVFSRITYRIGCDPMVRYSTETLVYNIK